MDFSYFLMVGLGVLGFFFTVGSLIIIAMAVYTLLRVAL